MTTKAKKTCKAIVNVVLWVFLVFAITMTILAFLANASSSTCPRIGNKCFLCVASDSMEGDRGFSKGDFLISTALTQEEAQNLNVDDVITFLVDLDKDGVFELNTHRIIRIEGEGSGILYKTQGDNNPTEDEYYVGAGSIVSRWDGKKVNNIGAFISFIQSKWGFFGCIICPMAGIFIYQLVVLIRTIKEVKGKSDKRTISQEEEEMIKQRAIEEFLAKQNAQK